MDTLVGFHEYKGVSGRIEYDHDIQEYRLRANKQLFVVESPLLDSVTDMFMAQVDKLESERADQLAAANERIKALEAENAKLTYARDEALIVYRALNDSYQVVGRDLSTEHLRADALTRAMRRVVRIARHWRGVAHGEV